MRPGELAPLHETTFTVVCGDYSASARDIVRCWWRNQRRSWAVRGPDFTFAQSAGFEWAAAKVWSLHHDHDVFSSGGWQQTYDPARQLELDAWLGEQRIAFEAFRVECARTAGEPDVPALPRPESLDGLGKVYLIGADRSDLVKVGFTDGEVHDRLRKLQTGSPARLRVLLLFPGSAADERALHRRFAHLRVRGEWFRNTEEVRAVFAGILLDRAGLK